MAGSSWGRHLGSLLVHTGIGFEESTEDLADSELNLIDVFEESGFLDTSEVQDGPNLFVIDLDWVVKAWTLGVNRFGLMWYGKSYIGQSNDRLGRTRLDAWASNYRRHE